jgi:glyoxylase-like metal-dependent hydrolase (beta-lactamase superfamily II)
MSAKIVEVHPGVYEIFLPLPARPTIINVWLFDCHGAWALIDTGMRLPDSIQTLEEALATVGIKVEDLDVLIGTHHHPDHFGASLEIQQRSGAQVYLHRLEQEKAARVMTMFGLAQRPPEAQRFFERHGIPPQTNFEQFRPSFYSNGAYSPALNPHKYIQDGDVIPVGDRRFEVIWTPGHSPGHAVIYLRDIKVMVVGDHLLPRITPHVGIYPDSTPDPLGDFINSQMKVQKFDVDLVLPAHGGTYHDHRHRANQIIEHHRYREEEMLDLLKHQSMTAWEVARQVFGDEERPFPQWMAATFETLAHLEHAYLEGRAHKFERGDRIVFQAN